MKTMPGRYVLRFTDHNQVKMVIRDLSHKRAIELINRAILDCGYHDATVRPEPRKKGA